MADDFQVGDVVVCVNKERVRCPHINGFHDGTLAPPLKSIGRVAALGRAIMYDGTLCGCCVLEFSDGSSGLFDRFRKLPKADEQFTEQMRAMRSRTKRVPA